MSTLGSKYKRILFDADNTLFDFDRASYLAFNDLLEKQGLEFSQELFNIYHHINIEVWGLFEKNQIDSHKLRLLRFERFFDQMNWEVDTQACSKYYLSRLVDHTNIYHTTIDMIIKLKSNYQLGIVTNGLKEVQRPRIEKLGLTSYFDVIVVSDEIGYSKPNQEYFEYTYNQIGRPEKESILMVGDSLRSDIAGGNNFGIDTCWYNPTAKENNTSVSPTFIISSHNQLIELLNNK